MVLHDDRTGRGHPLPHPDNLLEDDVQRLRTALDGLDRDATALESGKADADLSNVPAAAFKAKAAAVGLSLPAVTGADAGKSLIVNPEGTGYQVGAAGSAIQQSGPLYAPGGSGFSLTGRSVVAAYEQIAGQTFNIGYTTESDYAQQDAANGTDASGGAFVLHNTAGAVIDGNTKLLIHADGVNGSTEIIDERGITPFGTSCAYFDGTAYWTIPSSSKIAFGPSQNFTFEGWARVEGFDANNQTDILQVYTGSTMHLTFNYGGDASMRVGSGGGFSTAVASGVPVGSWFHWAIVRNAGTMKGYVNGVEKTSFSETYNYPSAFIALGRRATNNTCFQTGWQDQVRVSKVARYIAAFSPPTAEFTTDADTVHLFQFNDGHGSQFIRDSAKSGHEILLRSGTSISNAQAAFGTTSALSSSSSGGLIAALTKPHADFNFQADNFTVDFRFYQTTAGTVTLWQQGFGDFAASVKNVSNALTVYLSTNGTTWNLASGLTAGTITLNQMHHVAITRSGTNIYVFLDGVLGQTIAIGTSALSLTGSASPHFGCKNDGLETLPGYLDEIRIKRGQAVWTSNFTPPTSAYATDDYTVLLCHFEGANGDKVTLDSSESSYGTNGFGDTTIPTLSFVGSAVLDTTYTRGGNSTSLKLNGSSQYASIQFATPSAGHPIYFSASDKLCIEGWFYFSSFVLNGGVGVRAWDLVGVSNAAATELSLYFGTGGVPSFLFNAADVAIGPACSVGWNHVAVVREGRGWAVYSNGVAGTIANPQTNVSYASEAYTLYLGTNHASTGYMTGAIDSFRITHGKPRYEANFTPGNLIQDADTALLWVFNGASGQKWVKELSRNTALIPSTNARTVKDGRYITPVLTGANVGVSTSSPKFGTGSLSVAGGAGNYLSLPFSSDFAPSGDFTFETWIKPSSTGSDQSIACKTNDGSTSYTWQLVVLNGGYARFDYYDTANILVSVSSASGVLSTSLWVHVAAVRTSGTLKIYINGTQSGSSVTATNGMRQDTAGGVRLGTNYDDSGLRYVGLTDELRISSTARWTANFTPPTIPYGQQYVTGPHWVATKPGASSLDLSAFSSIDSASFSGGTPLTTSLAYLISTDGYATPLKRWNGAAWVATAHSMIWAAPTLTTTATAAQLNAAGNSWAELSAGLAALDVSAVGSLNVVAILSTANPQYTPSLDAITLNMDEYQLMQPGVDYTVRRRKANGVQTLTFTRVKAGNANHVVDCVG